MAQKLIELTEFTESSRGKVYPFAFSLEEASINDLRVYVDMEKLRKYPRFVSVCVGLKDPYAGADTVKFSLYVHPTEVVPSDFEIVKLPETERGLATGYEPVVSQAIPYGELERFVVVAIEPTTGDLDNPTEFVGWISFIL